MFQNRIVERINQRRSEFNITFSLICFHNIIKTCLISLTSKTVLVKSLRTPSLMLSFLRFFEIWFWGYNQKCVLTHQIRQYKDQCELETGSSPILLLLYQTLNKNSSDNFSHSRKEDAGQRFGYSTCHHNLQLLIWYCPQIYILPVHHQRRSDPWCRDQQAYWYCCNNIRPTYHACRGEPKAGNSHEDIRLQRLQH